MITTIDLTRSPLAYPMLSHVLLDAVSERLEDKKKVYLYLNQR